MQLFNSLIDRMICNARMRQLCSVAIVIMIVLIIMTTSAQAQTQRSADLNNDSRVDDNDVVLLSKAFGACPGPPQPCAADLNADGTVDGLDMALMIDAIANGQLAAPAPQGAVIGDGHNALVHEAFPEVLQMAGPMLEQPPVPISLGRAAAFVAGANIHDLGEVTAERIAQANAERAARYGHIQPGPKRVGIVRQFQPPLSIDTGDARFQALEDGTGLWTMEIRPPGAYHLRVHFENIDLGRSSMVIYGFFPDGAALVKGPYHGRGLNDDGDFWSASVAGDQLRIEIVGPDQPRLSIAEIVHFDDPMNSSEVDGDGADGGPLSCHLDVMCQSVNTVARQATGQMNYVSLGLSYVCSGTLLNDLDNQTAVPYFITAFHCLNTQTEVNSLQVVWFWQKSACNGTLPNYSMLPSSNGGTLLVTNNTSSGNDMSFIRLPNVPNGVGFAGWTTASLNSGHGIHHPSGSWKRATWFEPGSGLCLDPLDYDYYEITSGAIEGGSSGSGIFNSSGQFSGQLYGFCNQSNVPPCSSQVGSTLMYGEFESTWEDTNVDYWLTLGGTIHVWWATPFPPGNGTSSSPYVTVALANAASWNGSQIKIIAGSYNETPTFSKSVTILAVNGTVTIGQ